MEHPTYKKVTDIFVEFENGTLWNCEVSASNHKTLIRMINHDEVMYFNGPGFFEPPVVLTGFHPEYGSCEMMLKTSGEIVLQDDGGYYFGGAWSYHI